MRHAIITTTIATLALGITGMVAYRTFFPSTPVNTDPAPIVFQPTIPVAASDDPKIGSRNPKHTIIMFGDFQCLNCAQVSSELKTVLTNHPEAQLVWKDAPDTMAHPWSMEAAIAGRCAYQQKKFWEMHDALFATPFADTANITSIARTLSLDMTAYQSCHDAEATKKRIQASLLLAQNYGITATPYFFVNGKPVGSLATAAEFEPYLK